MLHSPLYTFQKGNPIFKEYHLQSVKYFRGHNEGCPFFAVIYDTPYMHIFTHSRLHASPA
ncbi:hypothetical protein MTBBW1_340051 [Desulfamplus magnetovallimortis]|uniref:Uncharacterized protein n=1 Tax=Desulfamplus magnetovallimortis TaxID=1246637 RepID=A0A1W1HG96_9BACT|nr:hypothetical protein MTBBW1_340051 [Desulfamplus magnetovallimortis]